MSLIDHAAHNLFSTTLGRRERAVRNTARIASDFCCLSVMQPPPVVTKRCNFFPSRPMLASALASAMHHHPLIVYTNLHHTSELFAGHRFHLMETSESGWVCINRYRFLVFTWYLIWYYAPPRRQRRPSSFPRRYHFHAAVSGIGLQLRRVPIREVPPGLGISSRNVAAKA
ncbi:hypothetical protein GQ53DRAFT_472472 [Thozetella sp. PMI_491]|nr:hypothetical protein GQ53DRAFT_472472 [Thozetella sp. PMI_491]